MVTTNSSGLATASTFTANGTAGSYSVTAVAAGVVNPATFSLINDKSFTIAGNIPGSSTQGFYPGLTQPLNLTITNPYNFSITLTGITVTVPSGNAQSGCANSNMTVSRAFNALPAVQIPANTTETLTAANATAAQLPQLTMLHSAPNACQGASFQLGYSGTASKS